MDHFLQPLNLNNKKHLLSIVGTVFVFLAIPLTVFVAINIRDNRSKAATPGIDISTGAIQTVHQTAVPHTDVAGNFRNSFDSSVSFFPIGIYNPTLCQVTQNLSWTAPLGYSGEYRIKVNYGSSRVAGTYLLADINVGLATSATVGNLPPNTLLYYSVWKQGTSQVVEEKPFTSTTCTNVAEDQNLQNVSSAGFNTAILEKNIYPDTNVINKAQSSGLKLLLDMRDHPTGTFSNLKNNSSILGFYVGDDDLARAKYANTDSDPNNNVDVNSVYTNLKSYSDSLDTLTQKVVLEAEPGVPTNDAAWWPWYQKFDSVGNVSFHYNYPKSSSPFIPWRSVSDVADTVKQQIQNNGSARPSWFIAQAINLKWVIPLEFPTASENRAMVYTALVHGATGIFQFSHDGWLRRQPKGSPAPANQGDINWYDRHAGIKKTTPVSYPGGDKWAYSASLTETAASMNLWRGIDASQNGLNKELQQLRPVLLSPTSSDAYKVFVDQRPISSVPIRTILKNFNGEYYLFAVNIDNATITANFGLTGKNFDRAEVMFENRSAAISGGNSITETFAPYDVNIYKLTPASVQSPLLGSQRKVCSLLGANQTAVGIGGQDAGTSVKIGSESFWTFGDTLNTSRGLFLPNNIAKTADLDAADCVTLTSKASGGTAQALIDKLPGELGAWPDGMVSVQAGTGHFYFMSVRACSAPEPCAFGSLGAWKVKGIGLAKFDAGGMNSTRVGGLLWQESDNNGFEIAGATAVVDSGYVYVFLNESPDGVNQYAARIARVPVANIENKASYQYWNGTSWVGDIRSSVRVLSFPGAFNGVSVAYNQFLGKWTAIYTTADFSTVAMRTAAAITGPWSSTDDVLVDCASVFPTETGLKCYFGRQHLEYAKGNGQTIYVSYANQANYQTYLHEVNFKLTGDSDSDGDGFLDSVERYVGTDTAKACDVSGVPVWPPDIDNDQTVTILDLTLVSNAFLTRTGDPIYNKRYDMDADGAITILDLTLIANYFLQPCTSPVMVPVASRPDVNQFIPKTSKVIEAETFKLNSGYADPGKNIFSDAAASGGKGFILWSAGSAQAVTSNGFGKATFRVKADVCSGAPKLTIKIDGKVLYSQDFLSTSWADVTVNFTAVAGTNHTILVELANDRYKSATCDRNLRFDKVTLF